MKNVLRFLVIYLISFLVIINFPFTNSQAQTLPGNKIDGFPVTLNSQTLFLIQAKTGSFSPEERAETITNRLNKFAENNSFSLDSLEIEAPSSTNTYNIVSDNKILITITEEDAKAARKTQQELADKYLQKVKKSVTQYRHERTLKARILAAIYTVIATISIWLIIKIINWFFPQSYRAINQLQETYIPGIRFQNIEFLSSQKVANSLISFLKFIRVICYLAILYIYIPLVLSFFPLTRGLSHKLFQYLLSAIKLTWVAFISYIPNLFIISLIILITYYILRFIKFIFTEIDRGNISFPGFYREWAIPTYNISLFLIIALALVFAFPYLPGSNSPAFRGVSVFLGILFSLGSTSAVANTVGGIILIYTRSFQIGDRVQIGDIIGDVEEKTILVTRIRTPKNVLVTLPNSTVLNSNVINYSASERDTGIPLILNTTITLGYDVPWRTVYQVLLDAALATEHILQQPAPFVLQTSLDDFYVSYELNVYTDKTLQLPFVYSELHEHIQDKCNEAGIEILSPHYGAMRDGNQTTIPENYLSPDYQAPGFRLNPLKNFWNS